MDDWKPYAAALAEQTTHPQSRWRAAVETVPRHEFVPAWWQREQDGWTRHTAEDDLQAVYEDVSLVTRVGPLHADHAKPGDTPTGRSTSSSTHPSLLVKMYRYAMLDRPMDVLDVGTGSGYGTALLCHRLGDQHVTSVDVDPYLVEAATERLRDTWQAPTMLTADTTTDPLPDTYDRIVATVALRPIPPALVTALRPGGRLVTVIDGTRAILTADREPDGRLFGRIERDWAGFMGQRHDADYPADVDETKLLERDGEHVARGLYPLADLDDHWELVSFLGIEHPGIEARWHAYADGTAIQLLWHADGSWARGRSAPGDAPTVHWGGSRNLWALVDDAKTRWLTNGGLPVYGASAMVGLDGSIDIRRGNWRAVIGG